MAHKTIRAGFTLIEILVVIGIIGLLSMIVVLSVNPMRKMSEARDVRRNGDINALLNAIYHYRIAHNGRLPGCLGDSGMDDDVEYRICVSNANPECDIDLKECPLTELTGSYLPQFPIDPQQPSDSKFIGYSLWRAANGRVTVTASGELMGISSAGYTQPQIIVVR